MNVTVKIAEPLRNLAGGSAEAQVQADTVQKALYQLARLHPGLRLFNCDGDLRGVLQVRRDGRPAEMNAPLSDNDTIELATA